MSEWWAYADYVMEWWTDDINERRNECYIHIYITALRKNFKRGRRRRRRFFFLFRRSYEKPGRLSRVLRCNNDRYNDNSSVSLFPRAQRGRWSGSGERKREGKHIKSAEEKTFRRRAVFLPRRGREKRYIYGRNNLYELAIYVLYAHSMTLTIYKRVVVDEQSEWLRR